MCVCVCVLMRERGRDNRKRKMEVQRDIFKNCSLVGHWTRHSRCNLNLFARLFQIVDGKSRPYLSETFKLLKASLPGAEFANDLTHIFVSFNASYIGGFIKQINIIMSLIITQLLSQSTLHLNK